VYDARIALTIELLIDWLDFVTEQDCQVTAKPFGYAFIVFHTYYYS